MRVGRRFFYVSSLLARTLPFWREFSLRDYQVRPEDPTTGWFKLVLRFNNAVIYVFEFLSGGVILKYAYTLLIGSEVVLRYDNAPHHRDLPTFPHHKHVRGEIRPLERPSIEEFVKEVKPLVLKARKGP